jgi:UDP-N-acetylglucosamine--N-acetylmuramyl-(pentapeptide) pyrophosphoryl-undecaprenol N-acetylglucosamine transferase
MKNYNFLIAAGGTGGHLFPAISVVEELSKISNNFTFHFTGRDDKIEGRIIRDLGYPFHPIEVEGLRNIFSLKNFLIPFKILQSERKIKKIIKKYNIDAVIATGAYISYPPSIAASKIGVPLFLMESNFNPGKSISMLASKAEILFTSFPETINFFQNKSVKNIVYAGNPVRNTFSDIDSMEDAKLKLGFDPKLPLLFVFGGSLGSKVINDAIENSLNEFSKIGVQLLWQTGDSFTESNNVNKFELNNFVKKFKFIDDMASAYAASDLIVSRSGASTLSELALMGKPSILIPLHIGTNKEQEYNARFFEKNGAAIVLPQSTISVSLLRTIQELIFNQAKLKEMELCIKRYAKPDAAKFIAQSIITFLDNSKNEK